MNILLHICCAPCAIYPVTSLKSNGHKFAGFFYNPNIHPYSEYLKRKDAAVSYGKEAGLNIIIGDYDMEKYFQFISYDEKLNDRCPVCWWIRLEKSARFAKENSFDAFTTTLLGSPYQDHEVIKSIGEEIARNTDTVFYYEDFRVAFKDAHAEAKSKGIYCQNYCGCVFSERERIEKKKGKG